MLLYTNALILNSFVIKTVMPHGNGWKRCDIQLCHMETVGNGVVYGRRWCQIILRARTHFMLKIMSENSVPMLFHLNSIKFCYEDCLISYISMQQSCLHSRQEDIGGVQNRCKITLFTLILVHLFDCHECDYFGQLCSRNGFNISVCDVLLESGHATV